MIHHSPVNRYIDREKSWLAFNARVLQEAADENVPLLDRLRFLGIFSNNLDEFFRVRYAAIRRLSLEGNTGEKILGGITADKLLKEITEIVIEQQSESLRILSIIEKELQKENVYILNESEVSKEQGAFIKDFFIQKVSPELVTIILNDLDEFPLLKDASGYLAVKLVMKPNALTDKPDSKKEVRYAVIEMPKTINRFLVLPSDNENKYIILLDDVIRYNLHNIFNIFKYETVSAHMIKITRDAELEIDSDQSKSLMEKISKGILDRRVGEPVRFVYDQSIEDDTLAFFLKRMGIDSTDSIIPGGRYHNRRDYMSFPTLGMDNLTYKQNYPLPVNGLSLEGSIVQKMKKKDYLIYAPYQSFAYVIKFLREAALDPKVISIKITLYRLAKNSQIISSLINAAKNGKKVTVQIELQARFDEASNISYAEVMQSEGINLIFGVKGLKVHSKVCVVERVEEKKVKRYGFISTGNFNESTAKIYTDVTLLTSHQQIMKEVSKIFDFFDVNYRINRYKHLLVSPQYARTKFYKLIDKEILNAIAGKEAYIKLKMNSLTDFRMIDKLYEASREGVRIQLIIRGICCLIPGIEGMSENIEAISIVDNYLEHSRIYIFANSGDPEVYISSADFMTRNLDARVEVTCPIYDEEIKQELIDTFEIGWKGNVKARLHSESLDNEYRRRNNAKVFRAQLETYNYYRNKLEVIYEQL
ncbi:polyphosphate kinase 1 [Flavobacterium salilacus subsp. salilacus]|uniref:polyphosphate kinase 1 n=1 Tax=Flavobacterium TaxID=237 RepID=UPI00107586D3|nr:MULTISPECIES: polyphosphate kinase 1 [Flavobacterium]KAF2518574.1 polyphosphate kinase 1 [Flavobacterium salilacus subsp. salilacus]MBE1613530.1 polyphosphate kinase 1 [Flavobacterium sp. SaA2.13]NDI99248.1 polyphosphate kinase 1 [Flavobacterium salilacus subsp. altitudinum]